jgi:hypothetical protein
VVVAGALVDVVAAVAPPDLERVPSPAVVVVAAPGPATAFVPGTVVVGAVAGAVLAAVVGVTGADEPCAGGTSVDALQICA